ncbi:MAG TPA: sialidase family protein [Candidatus Lokiarchaeia archaeon]|nr:sialidase family protein [Candidatus Lokiarchaeia archaeon]
MLMNIAWESIQNPIFDRDRLNIQERDGALHFHDGVFYLYHCAVEYPHPFQYQFYTDVITSTDLVHWSAPQRLWDSDMGFSSPGNVFRAGDDKWMLCVQTYPIERFHWWGSDACRLWTSESNDLLHWSFPRVISEEGCKARWTKERRQIDPFILPRDGKYWCFFKSSGQLGLLVSDDLETWIEASPDRPVFAASETPDHTTIENACVVEIDGECMMFFSPCYNKRGIGIARSPDLFHWTFDRYLNFPKFTWAKSGPTAPSVIDAREETGKWLMAFHAERRQPHHAALALAWSEDLIAWETT